MTGRPERHIPEATVGRLPIYLRVLAAQSGNKVTTMSSESLARLAGVNAANVRKDLSYLGSYGTRGVGYDVQFLLDRISRELGMTREWPCVIVGAGNLGAALANYAGFRQRGFRVVGLVDADTSKVGTVIAGVEVQPDRDLEAVVHDNDVAIGIIATPSEVAQDVADRLVSFGVNSILNFAPTVIDVPHHVSVRKVDLGLELQILTFYQERQGPEADEVSPDRAAG